MRYCCPQPVIGFKSQTRGGFVEYLAYCRVCGSRWFQDHRGFRWKRGSTYRTSVAGTPPLMPGWVLTGRWTLCKQCFYAADPHVASCHACHHTGVLLEYMYGA